MARQAVQAKVYWHMTQNPYVIQHASVIAEHYGFNVGSVSHALLEFSRRPKTGITAVEGKRGAYIYSGPRDGSEDVKQMQVGDTARCIGYSSRGEPLIVTDNDVVYLAKPVA